MRSFSEENYRNIQSLFTEKTGVPLRKRRAARAAPFVLAAAVLAALLTVTALAADLFSPLAGDDLALGAVYEGDGVVSVRVENRSDKELKFQEQLRLLRWDTSEEIAPKRGAAVRFANTAFAPHTEGVMTLDLSRAYDLAALDEPLAQGGYYLVLTNSNFVFGQDWICFIHAAAPETAGDPAEAVPEKTPEPTAAPLAPAETDAELTARVEETLRPYFEMSGDVAQRRSHNAEYYAACSELLAPLGTRVARPAPSDLVIGDAEEGVIFDPAAPADAQHLLTGENYTTLDAYGLPVGGAPGEEALVLSALVAQRAGDTDGGAPIPVVYLFTYFREDVENADHLFVHGRLVPLSEVEDRRVYEDERYVCYELSEYFYTDVQTHAETLCEQRGDVCWNDAARQRVQKIYDYYSSTETLARLVRHLAA